MAEYPEGFVKLDGLGLGNGQPWTVITAGLRTTSDQAHIATALTGINAMSRMDRDLASPDHAVDAIITQLGTANYHDIQLLLRFTDINNYYAILRGFRTASGRFVGFRKNVAGVITDLYIPVAFVAGEKLTASVQGTTIRALINDVEVGSWEDASIAAGNFTGLGMFRSASTATLSVAVDSFTARNFVLAPAAPTVPTLDHRNASEWQANWTGPGGSNIRFEVEVEEWMGEGVPA